MLLLNWSQGTIRFLVHPLVPAILFIISQGDIEQTRGKKILFRPLLLPTTGAPVVMPVAGHGAEIFAKKSYIATSVSEV